MIDDAYQGSLSSIRQGYAKQLMYYRDNKGKKSELAGVIITDRLINTLEKRYQQLGGNLIKLYRRNSLPSNNGTINPS